MKRIRKKRKPELFLELLSEQVDGHGHYLLEMGHQSLSQTHIQSLTNWHD